MKNKILIILIFLSKLLFAYTECSDSNPWCQPEIPEDICKKHGVEKCDFSNGLILLSRRVDDIENNGQAITTVHLDKEGYINQNTVYHWKDRAVKEGPSLRYKRADFEPKKETVVQINEQDESIVISSTPADKDLSNITSLAKENIVSLIDIKKDEKIKDNILELEKSKENDKKIVKLGVSKEKLKDTYVKIDGSNLEKNYTKVWLDYLTEELDKKYGRLDGSNLENADKNKWIEGLDNKGEEENADLGTNIIKLFEDVDAYAGRTNRKIMHKINKIIPKLEKKLDKNEFNQKINSINSTLDEKLNINGDNLKEETRELLVKKLNVLENKKDAITNLNIQNESITREKLASDLRDQIDKKVSNEMLKNNTAMIYKDMASVVAMANLPQVSGDKYASLSLAYGNAGKESAFAIGLSGNIPNRMFVYKGSVGVNLKGKITAGFGVNVSLGQIKNENEKVNLESKKMENLKTEIERLNKENEYILNELKNMKLRANEGFNFIEIKEFALGEYVLTDEQKYKLDILVDDLNYKEAYITGYCDLQGMRDFNLNLGLDRAKEVAKYLESKGIVIKHIRSFGYNAIVDTKNSNNRRVEIILK